MEEIKYPKAIRYNSEFMEDCSCPQCGDTDQEYLETILENCKCILKKRNIIHFYKCNNCKTIYGIKDE